MVLYNSNNHGTNWPKSVEIVWQQIGVSVSNSRLARELAPKMPHLSLTDILFMGAIANMDNRPHGIMTWTAEMFDISRLSLYRLKERVKERLSRSLIEQLPTPPPEKEELARYIQVSQRQIDRFILTATFPGNVATRPLQTLLEEAYGENRSVGYISELRQEAGRRAGELLANIRYESMGPVIALRDETFFNGHPILIVVDPTSTLIVGAYVCPDRTAETWATVLIDVADKGVQLVGLVEDMAKIYPQSLQDAELEEVHVQKDIWHFLRDMTRVTTKLEKQAYSAIAKVDYLERKLAKAWNDELFSQEYIPAVAAESRRINRYDAFAEWASHLADALLLVDPYSGHIRDFETNHWLLNECLTALSQMAYPLIRTFTKKLRKYQYQLLAFFDWSSQAVVDYDLKLSQLIPDATARQQFIRTTAQCWALDKTVINGHAQWRHSAQMAQDTLDAVALSSPQFDQAVQELYTILDATIRASSLVEMINGLLKSFLRNRKSFPSPTHLQYYLNLFVLWHNSRVYAKRSKRGHSSPFQLAGIDLPNQDWLTLLGFAPAN